MSALAELPVAAPGLSRELLCERFNYSEQGSKFTCRMIEPGIVSYKNTPENDVILLRKETIDRCLASAMNNPLTIDHIPMDPDVPEELKNGAVSAVRYNADDGWYYVEGIVETDHARGLIKKGYLPSCAYRETKVVRNNTGAKYHGFHYDKEITELEFHHLAIVKKPRYEGAVFRLNTIVSSTPMNIVKLIKKIIHRENDAAGKPVETTKTETMDINSDATIEIDGTAVRLNSILECWKKYASPNAIMAAGDEEIELPCEGDYPAEKVRMNDLIANYRKNGGKRVNAEQEEAAAAEKKKKDDEEKAARENSALSEVEKQKAAAAKAETDRLAAEEVARKNAAGRESFHTLEGARFRTELPAEGSYSTSSGSLSEKCAKGKARY